MFILASSSSSRIEILNKLGLKPELIISPEIDETHLKKETPKMLSVRLAKAKGLKISKLHPNTVVLSADTIVCVGRTIIDKCLTKDDVKQAMLKLSGKNHKVITTVCTTLNQVCKTRTTETKVKFKKLLLQEIEAFAESNEGLNKAGGYSINGIAESFILQIVGSISGVVGLPSLQTINLLKSYKISST